MKHSSVPGSSTLRRRVARVAGLLAGMGVASTAQAANADVAVQAVQGMLAFFADPENVRGLFGATLGAVAAVIAARPFNKPPATPRRPAPRSDDT